MKSIFFTLTMILTTGIFALSVENPPERINTLADVPADIKEETVEIDGKDLVQAQQNHVAHLPKGGKDSDAVYGSFFSTGTALVPPGGAVPFSGTTIASSGVQLLPSGTQIQITQAGDYYVMYGISLETGTNNRVALALNGLPFLDGSNLAFAPTEFEMTSLSTTFRVTPSQLPATLSVVNISPTLSFKTAPGSAVDISGYLVIQKIAPVK
jgi:hypothetical protein